MQPVVELESRAALGRASGSAVSYTFSVQSSPRSCHAAAAQGTTAGREGWPEPAYFSSCASEQMLVLKNSGVSGETESRGETPPEVEPVRGIRPTSQVDSKASMSWKSQYPLLGFWHQYSIMHMAK